MVETWAVLMVECLVAYSADPLDLRSVVMMVACWAVRKADSLGQLMVVRLASYSVGSTAVHLDAHWVDLSEWRMVDL